jgi:hypothetical protein
MILLFLFKRLLAVKIRACNIQVGKSLLLYRNGIAFDRIVGKMSVVR